MLISLIEFAQKVGVSRQAVGLAVKTGRLQSYAANGKLLPPDHRGRKWLNADEARLDWARKRLRFDERVVRSGREARGELIEARRRKLEVDARLQEIKLAEKHGTLIPKAAAHAMADGLGRAIQRTLRSIAGWSEEVYGAGQSGGLTAVSCLLRAKSIELSNALADLIIAEPEAEAEAGQADGDG